MLTLFLNVLFQEKNNLRLNHELEALRTDFAGLQTKCAALSQEKDGWLVELGSDEKALEIEKERVSAQKRVEELEQSAAGSRLEYTEIFNKYHDLNYDFKLLQQENDKSKTDNDRLMEEVEELRDEVEVLDNQNHQMQQWLGKYQSTRTVLDGAHQKNTVCFALPTNTHTLCAPNCIGCECVCIHDSNWRIRSKWARNMDRNCRATMQS